MNKKREPTPLMRVVFGRNQRRTLVRAAVAGLLTYVVLRFVILPVRLRGISMEPTYRDGSFHLANLLSYTVRPPARGDVVVIEMTGRRALYLKRVLGLPGDRVSFSNGTCYINGAPLNEDYLEDKGQWTIPELVVPKGEYFVAGDNRRVEWESHTLGTVPRRKILGTILF